MSMSEEKSMLDMLDWPDSDGSAQMDSRRMLRDGGGSLAVA